MQIKVRIEEIAAGAVLGTSLGLAVATPLAVGMPSLIPTFAAGAWGFVQSAIAFCLTCGGAVLGGWLASTQERDSHNRGARYYSDPIAAVRALQEGEVKQFSAGQQRGGVRGIEIGGVHLARSREVGHVYAVGLPGSGKTVLLTSIIDHPRQAGAAIPRSSQCRRCPTYRVCNLAQWFFAYGSACARSPSLGRIGCGPYDRVG